jgi:8-oxo-dGTP diphosphatase
MASDHPALSDARPFTEVAVGLVLRQSVNQTFDEASVQEVLMGQRPEGKAYAGWWEFPGGKIEAGEAVDAALARELREELNLNIQGSSPWVVRTHSYPHARVRLHFRRIFNWTGEPTSMERQAFAWQPVDRIGLEPLLPAALPLLDMLRWPSRLVALGFNNAGTSLDQCVASLTHPAVQAGRKLVVQWDDRLGAEAQVALEGALGPLLDGAGKLGIDLFLPQALQALKLPLVAGYWRLSDSVNGRPSLLQLEVSNTPAATIVLDPRLSRGQRERLALQAEVPLYWCNQRDLELGGHGAVILL